MSKVIELPFTKMHGLGNDYVYVNVFELPEDLSLDWQEVARTVSDRHFGIGSDGLILLTRSDKDADVQMRMFNSDGSESEMCGNGIRCVCKLAYDRGVNQSQPMKIETGNGVLSLAYETKKNELDQEVIDSVAVEMGQPIMAADRIPLKSGVTFDPQRFSLAGDLGINADWVKAAGAEDTVASLSMGNPHLVIYVQDINAAALADAGRQLETHELFPNRINIHFVEVLSQTHVKVLHWERGSGATLACGTGACSVCVAGVLLEKTGRSITADLPGGPLQLEWREGDQQVLMTGPATEVYTGIIRIPV